VSFDDGTAILLAESAARAVERDPAGFHAVLNDIPAAIYVADMEGTITYFNDACVEAVGRQPEAGVDKWCVSWKLYTPAGDPLPHRAQGRAIQGAGVQEADTGDRKAVHGRLQRVD